MDHSSSHQPEEEMDPSMTRVVVIDGRRYTVMRPARRQRDPRTYYRSYEHERVVAEYIIRGPKRARVGAASTEAIQRLLREVRAGDAAQTECAVCLQDYAAEETIAAMPVCAHAFHRHCISEWLTRNAVCPLCRRELPLPTHQDQEQDQEIDVVDDNGVRWRLNWIRVR